MAHKLIGATIREAPRTYGLVPPKPYGPDEIVAWADDYDGAVRTEDGNYYSLGGYLVIRHRKET